jgi:NADPH:quinone reductase-like Zn-dependent oxidoreductase
MKGIVFYEHGGPDVLVYDEVPDPEPGPGEVLVRVRAASVNRIDILVRRGYPGIDIPLPHILGADVAGVVEEIGDGVDNISIGDKVLASPIYGCGHCRYCLVGMENHCHNWRMLGFHIDGSYAEYVKVPGSVLVEMPRNLGFEWAAALPLALLTSWHALVTLGGLRAGETVLVWAGGSGIGTYSIQIAKSLGARVVATAGYDWKVRRLRDMGVDYVFNHYEDDVVGCVKDIGGVDLVVEHIGSATFNKSIDVCKVGGRIVVFGALTGDSTSLPIRKIYLKHLKIIGMHTGSRWELIDALRFVEDGRIKPIIDSVFSLRDAAEAHIRMENSDHFGKIVLRID